MSKLTIPFRILCLNGGGVRGVFQAVALSNISKQLEKPLWEYFDLICGTSTGSIIGIALAIGIEPERIVEFYKNYSNKIFKAKFFASLRTGARYNNNELHKCLTNILGTKQVRDVKTKILVPSSCLDQFSHRVFSSFHINNSNDRDMLLVDIAMSSCAAPTYFAPVKPTGQERSYLDGGLWANSPSLTGVLWAHRFLHIPFEAMRVLSIGTGDFSGGELLEKYSKLRPISPDSIRSIFEIMFAAQESSADFHSKELVGAENYKRISAVLDKPIHLDDVEKALSKLPALAEMQINDNIDEILSFLSKDVEATVIPNEIKKELVPYELIEAAGLTGFYPSRRFYSYRKTSSRIDSYINTANKSLIMVSINLMTGLHFDNLCKVLKEKLENDEINFHATISLLNPNKANLIFAISPVLTKTEAQLQESITDTLTKLSDFKATLTPSAQIRFDLRVHNAIPFGSAIIIDHKESSGRIQIETKPYKAVVNDSFAFEVAPIGSSGLFGTLLDGYLALIKDGNSFEEIFIS